MEEVVVGAWPMLLTLFGQQAQHRLPGGVQWEGVVEQQTVLYFGAQCDEGLTLLTALCLD